MPTRALEALALALLGITVTLLLRRFAGRLAPFGPLTAACAALATAGGLIGAPLWWIAAPASFAWAMAPLAFRFLAAAGLAFGITGLAVLARPEPARVRLLLRMLAVYLLPLVAALLVLHRDRLDWHAPIAWGFVALAGGLALGATIALTRVAAVPPGPPPAPRERALWQVAAGLFGLWGLALFVTPQGPLALLWLWPQDALTSRLIGAMLLTLALIAGEAQARADLGRLAALVFAVYGAAVALACVLHAVAGRPLPLAYLVALGLAGLGGAIRARRP